MQFTVGIESQRTAKKSLKTHFLDFKVINVGISLKSSSAVLVKLSSKCNRFYAQ